MYYPFVFLLHQLLMAIIIACIRIQPCSADFCSDSPELADALLAHHCAADGKPPQKHFGVVERVSYAVHELLQFQFF
jgi:hypothetical protein